MLEDGTILICDGCHRVQCVKGEVRACAMCGGLTFHPQRSERQDGFVPKDPMLAYLRDPQLVQFPGSSRPRLRTEFPIWTTQDLKFLRVVRISPE